jgi:predicted GIY-YIG superfamily endonuclease
MIKRFNEIIVTLPDKLNLIKSSKKYDLRGLPKSSISKIFNNRKPVPGVYVMYDKDVPVYVGRSRNLAQRIGLDHRAKQKTQATMTYKLVSHIDYPEIDNMDSGREYLFNNYTVSMIQIDCEYERAIFEIYAAMTLNCKHNSFRET